MTGLSTQSLLVVEWVKRLKRVEFLNADYHWIQHKNTNVLSLLS